jgi:hypothetical protein
MELFERAARQSTYRAYDWLIHGYHVNERVKVLYNPNGPEIKIAGESIWLRYNIDVVHYQKV